MHVPRAADMQMLGTAATTAVPLPVPPASHRCGAASRPCGARGLIPQQEGGWGLKCPTSHSHSLPAACFTKIRQQSGCRSRVGWCLTPNPLRLVEGFSLTPEALGQADNSNNTTKIFRWAQRAAAPVSSHLLPHAGIADGALAFCSRGNPPACTHEVFPPLSKKGSSEYLYYHHGLS